MEEGHRRQLEALVDAEDQIVGFTMIGSEAGEMMAVVQAAMPGRLPYSALHDAILAHPTMAEGLTPNLATHRSEAGAAGRAGERAVQLVRASTSILMATLRLPSRARRSASPATSIPTPISRPRAR
ncbi:MULTISPECIES: hypothetical protein [Hyphomicrobiales]|uniref:hypothetical protein n=1 Tax=Hyphomicrobiales TaxID=356 RepID=UPI002FCC7273